MPRLKITGDDCKSCGACCLGGYEDGGGWADCTKADVARMSVPVRRQLVVIHPQGLIFGSPMPATPVVFTEEYGTKCKFLNGSPGKRCSCRIYDTRPDVCRDFKPGSRACRESRAALDLPV